MKILKQIFYPFVAVALFAAGIFFERKTSKPQTVVNNNVSNNVKKMKVKGKGNTQDTDMENDSTMDVSVDNSVKKEKKKLRLFGKNKKNK